MIPFIIKQARPSYDLRDNNVIIHHELTNYDEDLDKTIIKCIVNIMYEFCSKEYGYNIKISSYSDFCDKYWEVYEVKFRYWNSVFEVSYFNEKWNDWDASLHEQQIYELYQKLFFNN